MRFIKSLAPALLAASALSSCVDGPISSQGGGKIALGLAPEFSFAVSSSSLPIEVVRTTPRFAAGGDAGRPHRQDDGIGPDAESWRVEAPVDLGGRDTATVVIEVELISTASGSDVVEWSGVVGPIFIDANVAPETFAAPITLLRGPLSNAGVVSLSAHGPSFMYGSTSVSAYATVASQGGHSVRWSSSNPAVASVDPVGDTVLVHAHAAGTSWIRAGAGLHADSFLVNVDTTTPGEPALVEALPDSAVVIVGATRTWYAFVADSAGLPLDVAVSWLSLDAGIATVSDAGVVTGVSIGRARIVASAGSAADTVIAIVQALPPGVNLIWQGGTPFAETDWFTADNWSPARVPTASDVVYIPANGLPVRVSADAGVGGVRSDTLAYSAIELQSNVTLTVYGDLVIEYVDGDSTASLVMAGAGGALRATVVPALVVTGQVAMSDYLHVSGDMRIENGGTFDVGLDGYLDVAGGLTVNGAGLIMGQDSVVSSYSYAAIAGDITFDGGDSSTRLTGGYLALGGDFTVTATSCTAFRPNGLAVEMFSDTAIISIGCPGTSGNRFWDLYIYAGQAANRVITLQSDVPVANELYMDWDPQYPAYVVGNGFTVSLRVGSIYTSTFDRAFVEVAVGPGEYFYADSLAFTGMSGQSRPQLLVTETTDGCTTCYDWQRVFFDPASAGPYIQLNDPVVDGDSAVYYMAHNPGDGPQRTVTTGEGAVYWAGVPTHVFVWSGSGQTGTTLQPLPDSLVVEVVDYGYYDVEGATVSWSVTQGDGSVSPATSVTDTAGLAATQYTMGSVNFPEQIIQATVSGASSSAVFYAYPTAPAPAPMHEIAPSLAPRDGRLIDRRRERVAPPAVPERASARTTGERP